MAVIYAIPGFSCNKEIFAGINIPGHTLQVLNWPPPAKDYTLREYAGLFRDQIKTQEPFFLMGVSFGGMLCVELSEMVSAKKVILISSCKNRNELPAPVRFFKYFPLHLLLPENVLRNMAMHSGKIIGIPKSFLPELRRMINSMSPNYFRYCIHYIVGWKRKQSPPNLVHIHGDADRLLWHRKIKEPDYTIRGGDHAMIFFKAEEISKVLAEIISH